MDHERLRAIPVFATLDDETLRSVALFATTTSVPAGRELVREGDLAYEFMVIEEGTADVVYAGELLRTLGPGDFFGEIGVLDTAQRTASVVATTPMRLITLARWDLEQAGDALDAIRATLEQRRADGP